jgi:hypothetical protein
MFDPLPLFVTSEGNVIVKTDAACCSHTWIENIQLPALGLPAKVISVDDSYFESQEDGELKIYGCTIKTDKGEIVIEYRNESNGYYGGSLSWPDDKYFYGGVYGQNVSTMNWQNVVDT